MKIYESRFSTIDFIEEQKLIEITWLPETKGLSEVKYKEELFYQLNVILKIKPSKVLSDMREMRFAISSYLREWTGKTIFPKMLAIGLDRAALVLSNKLIAHLSIEQTMEEYGNKKFITQYFDNKEEAKEWFAAM